MSSVNLEHLEKAEDRMGRMLDYASHGLGIDLDEFFELFITTGVCDSFEKGELDLDGVAMAQLVLEKGNRKYQEIADYDFNSKTSSVYKAGQGYCYFSISTEKSYKIISRHLPFSRALKLYEPYFDGRINQFALELMADYMSR